MNSTPLPFSSFPNGRGIHRPGAVLMPMPDTTLIDLRGGDRVRFLHNFCTQHIQALVPGQGTETFVCNVQGRTVGYGRVTCHEEVLRFETAPGQSTPLLQHFDKYLLADDVELVDQGQAMAQFGLWGADSSDLLAKVSSQDGTAQPVSYLGSVLLVIDDQPTVVIRGGLGDPQSWLLQVDANAADQVAEVLVALGANLAAAADYDGWRIEANLPEFGADITDKCLPQEIDRDRWAIHFQKGCYLGQETVARLDALGHVNWRLVRLRAKEEPGWKSGSEVEQDGQTVGAITSANWAPTWAHPIAFARLRVNAVESGQPFSVQGTEVELIPPPVPST